MMNRRGFLKVSLKGVGYTLGLTLLAKCGSGDPEEVTYTSTTTSGHDHTLEVTCALLDDGESLLLKTSTDSGHSHEVQITTQHIALMEQGLKVTLTTSGSHTHTFQIQSC